MAVDLPQMQRIRDDFVQQMHAGLAAEGGSSLPMIPTHVDILPDGHEHGKFFSIDLGGTNLRVMYVKLPRGHGKVDVVEYEENPIPDRLRHAPQEELFDYLVDTLMAFADKVGWYRPGRRKMVVGFCFSFPIAQTALDKGTLIKWVKGFDCPGAVGQDVMTLLRDAFHRKKQVANLSALVNDTVGTLCSAQYGDIAENTDTCISIIVGTGTNCCYLDQLSNIQKFPLQHLPRTSDMVINTEWADYTSPELPWIEEDKVLDGASRYPGEHAFEKMTAGLYMSEVARLILVRLAEEGGLFGSDVPEGLRQHESLSTPQMEMAHEDESEELDKVAQVLQDAFGISPTEAPQEVRRQVQEVCALVCRRGARLTAAAIGGILFHLGRDPRANRAAVRRIKSIERGKDPAAVAAAAAAAAGAAVDSVDGSVDLEAPRNVVAVEGAVLRHYKSYLAEVQAAAEELMGRGAIFIEPAPLLSGTRGAALVAAAAKSYMSGLSFYEG
eukprot:CAMPEP_0206137798 /NCGR_PEP_ID=MMETSP1473-20131121/2852_1 /ASSEMBLY_ACC=CAM_ASM_001109 /TAXON_ID=1461547 /ORGANISM="Stichococcus sp, Strain RCC1054" /LENGTH=496 /DNA_ID=CAMNT_0053531037 /DNA_START=413 /DNA_END=1903 /DNA_ORIENTATION=-